MKPFLDIFPLILFFILYKFYDIYIASGALVIATALPLLFTWIRYRKVEKMALISFIMVAIFGTLTFFFRNDLFIKWKVTLFYGFLAMALFISQFFLKTPLLQKILGHGIQLPDNIWQKLNLAWGCFFLFCSLSNIYVAFYFPQNIWVAFKVFGLTTLTLLFTLFCVFYIYRFGSKTE